ncbi:hypothetical protein Fmac_010202 [Flemingia macrophylla]|uniref:YTH domain-containing family protein n=1 Tax=Flemingia macrophylla TaxID=520843 RepID=A0ABD1N2F6_9FABA
MNRSKELHATTQYVPKGTTNHSQQQNEGNVVSLKDCISSDLTTFATSSGDVAAGFTGAHGSESMSCYLPVSASVSVKSKTVEGSVNAESYPKSPGLMMPSSLWSVRRNGSLTRTICKTAADKEADIKILNKAPRLRSNFKAATPPSTYHQGAKFSSLANPRCHVFSPTNYKPYTSTNYISNGRISSVNDRFLSSDKFKSGESEMSVEMTRGPRGRYNNSLLQSSTLKDEFPITICRDQYNVSDFQTEYETAKFFVIKSFNEDDIHKGVKYNVWTSTPIGNKKLNAAFLDAEAKLKQTGTVYPVFLFFSVNASSQFVGVAEMLGPVDFGKDMNFWKLDQYNGFFPIKWHIIKDVPNNQLVHIILPNNENKPVTFTRDTQEIGLKEGLEMLKIFKNYSAKTSLLDDFVFYEKREKLFSFQRSSKHARPNHKGNGNGNYQNTVKAREMQSSGTLVNLTKNLSLNSSGKQGFG